MNKYIILCILPFLSINAASLNDATPNLGDIRIVGVDPTPEPDHAVVKIVFPKEGETKSNAPIAIQLRVEGYPLGTDSDFPRKKLLYNDPEGQSIHIAIDNEPYFELNEAFINSLDDSEEYFDQTLEFDIPFNLKPGTHLIRAYAARSFGESLKDDGAFATTLFNYQKASNSPTFDLSKPYITYNEPQGSYKYSKKTPLLLDFLIHNVELSKDGYKVRLTIDGTSKRVLTSWTPYFIYGLKQGKHQIRLELLDAQNGKVPGFLNDVTQTVILE